MPPIALLGYGRFGAALAGLLRDAGHDVRAFDERVRPPPELAAASPRELVEGAGVVVVAVPVARTREALASIAPHLAPGALVVEVGSVKLAPVAAMRELLGGRVAWIGAHPLFGPASLARGELPRRVVLCPTPEHPGAAAAARALFASIGCDVVEQSADEHDRVMAWTHALAFFLAKGMIDAGVPTDVPFAPPSFQAIARTVETVRADAGHLFGALHHANPYAPEARKALLDALAAVDRALDPPATDPRPPADDAALAIPEAERPIAALRDTRDQIDDLDQELVALLARRAELARRAYRAKAELGRAVVDPGREAAVLETRRAWAASRGLDADAVASIFDAVIRFARDVQSK